MPRDNNQFDELLLVEEAWLVLVELLHLPSPTPNAT